jgi:hypothetical protein
LLAILLASPDPRKIKLWREGLTDWKNAGELPEIDVKLPPPSPSSQARQKRTAAVAFGEAEIVARLYRRLVLLVGVQLFLGSLASLPDGRNSSDLAAAVALFAFIFIVVGFIALLVTSYKLTQHLGFGSPVARVICMCIPLLNLLTLFGIVSNANAWCKRNGITVGFFGPTRESLERLRLS